MNTILLVEDNEDDAFLMKRALRDAGIENPLHIAEDGQEAIDYLSSIAKSGPGADGSPMIVFLDLKLPLKSGHEVLAWIRSHPLFEKLIVIVLTSSNEPVDLNRSYELGANSYVVKPPTVKQLLEMAESFKLWWLKQNKAADLPPSAALAL